jgi:predicted small lipoprotein YifL
MADVMDGADPRSQGKMLKKLVIAVALPLGAGAIAACGSAGPTTFEEVNSAVPPLTPDLEGHLERRSGTQQSHRASVSKSISWSTGPVAPTRSSNAGRGRISHAAKPRGERASRSIRSFAGITFWAFGRVKVTAVVIALSVAVLVAGCGGTSHSGPPTFAHLAD